MKRLDLQKCIVGSVFTNCYFLKNKETEEMLIVDPGDNADRIEQKVLEMQGRPVAILLTHGHYDHILEVPKLQERWKEIPVYCNAKDIPESLTEYDMGQQFPTVRAFKNVKTIEDGQELVIAGTEITVMETPGHTPGSVLFLTKDAIFTGDTIFQGSIGRTDFEGGNERQMMQSLRKINNLAIEDITLCPGHGDTTTLKWERAHNSYLKMCR